MSVVFIWALKGAFVLGGALALSAALRRYSAAGRHSVLAAGVVAVLLLPLVSLVAPTWHVAAGAWTLSPGQQAALVWAVWGTFVAWSIGACIALLSLLTGLMRLAAVARRASLSARPDWRRLLDDLCRELAITRPITLLFSQTHAMPIAWGIRAPRILLPVSAHEWPASRRRVVLLHELAHIERGDWLIHLAADLTRATFWFNPLAWMASRRVRLESERACDDRVLANGIAAVDYATELLELARGVERHRERRLPAPAIVGPSSLERRVRAMLTPGLNRTQLTAKGRRAFVFAALALALALGGATAAQTFATFAGSVVDPTNAVLPQVTFVLTNRATGVKHEIKSDREGRVELPGLVPGAYEIEASLPGFSTFRSSFDLADGQRFAPALTMQVGELEETVTITDDGDVRRLIQTPTPRPTPRCGAAQSASPTRIGGNIRAPHRINNVPPEYPASLRGSGRSGVVELRGRIGPDGRMDGLTVAGEADPDFAASALSAVSQWEYDGTLLNCQPWPVNITVHLQFSGGH